MAFVARNAVTWVASPKHADDNRLVPSALWQPARGVAKRRRKRWE